MDHWKWSQNQFFFHYVYHQDDYPQFLNASYSHFQYTNLSILKLKLEQ